MLKALLLVLVCCCVIAILIFIGAHLNRRPLASNTIADQIVVEKAARRLTLIRAGAPLKVYCVALGRAPVGAKEQEGDQRTPEGSYVIDFHKKDSDFHRALHISYPSDQDVERAVARGVSPGGDIMIHGLPNGSGWVGALHRRTDWTAGCIAVTDSEIEEIWRAVPDGTPIEIRP
jgi:murein L,D-transpeptidase YafK